MSLLPLLCCVTACAAEGYRISDVYLPAGEWNDELFYFKQVEGMIKYGYPYGYFGFNESHALKLSYAAWSPVLVIPWILWGLVFGWNLTSPVYCNIFLMMLAVFVFVRLVKPSRKQMGILTILFCLYTPLTRYMLSGMPECICFSLAVIVLALGISYLEAESGWKLVLMFVLTSLLTLMRPYLLLFMLLPMYFLIKKYRWAGAAGSVLLAGLNGAVYAAVRHFLGAEYFTPLFDTTWITTFFDRGIFAGIKYIVWRLLHVGADFIRLMAEGVRNDLFWGEYFAAFTVVTAILVIQTVHNYRRKQKNAMIINLYLSVCSLGMWAALLLMYKMKEGSKHLLTFTVVGIFALCLMETRYYKKMSAAAVIFVYLFTATAVDPYEHAVPFRTEQAAAESDYWKEVFDRECVLRTDHVPDFDNVVIWVFNDRVGEEEPLTKYQMLYQLPGGFGISCCYADYVTENLQTLQSKYLAVVEGGVIDEMCLENGYRAIGRNEGLVIYELHE